MLLNLTQRELNELEVAMEGHSIGQTEGESIAACKSIALKIGALLRRPWVAAEANGKSFDTSKRK